MRMCVHNQLVIATRSKIIVLWVEKQYAYIPGVAVSTL